MLETASNIFSGLHTALYTEQFVTKCVSSSISPFIQIRHLLSLSSSGLSLFVIAYLPVSILSSFVPPLNLVITSLASWSRVVKYACSNCSCVLRSMYVRSLGLLCILAFHCASSLSLIFSLIVPLHCAASLSVSVFATHVSSRFMLFRIE